MGNNQKEPKKISMEDLQTKKNAQNPNQTTTQEPKAINPHDLKKQLGGEKPKSDKIDPKKMSGQATKSMYKAEKALLERKTIAAEIMERAKEHYEIHGKWPFYRSPQNPNGRPPTTDEMFELARREQGGEYIDFENMGGDSLIGKIREEVQQNKNNVKKDESQNDAQNRGANKEEYPVKNYNVDEFEDSEEVIEEQEEPTINDSEFESEPNYSDNYHQDTDVEFDASKAINAKDELDDEFESEIGSSSSVKSSKEDDRSEEAQKYVKSQLVELLRDDEEDVDLSSFSVSDSVVDIKKAKKTETLLNVSDWVLFNAQTPISIKEFSGLEIDKLDISNSSRTRYNALKDRYKLIVEKVQNSGKPEVEYFIRNVRFEDVPHIFFGIYKASFERDNIVPYECPDEKCGHAFVQKLDIKEMYRFTDKESEKMFNDIMNNGGKMDLSNNTLKRVPITKDIAVDLKLPSIYEIEFQNASLDRKFIEDNAEFITVASYIDSFYRINRETKSLDLIELRNYGTDKKKTLRYKLWVISKIMTDMTSKEHTRFTSMVYNLRNENNKVEYLIPENTCEKCNTKIEERIVNPQDLLFTRHSLTRIAYT